MGGSVERERPCPVSAVAPAPRPWVVGRGSGSAIAAVRTAGLCLAEDDRDEEGPS
eukprot:SAG22_NODE_406_length_10984_cov_28.344970_9_plen_55_part_00